MKWYIPGILLMYEMVQRRAARYVTNRYHNTSSVSNMIEQLEWTTLQERRKHSRLLMMYKLKNNIVRVDASSKLMPNERPRAGTFQDRSYEGHARFFFDRFVGDVYVPFKKTDGVVGVRADHQMQMQQPFNRTLTNWLNENQNGS
jgi:hypothetical protein